jgi:hypothetical protein
MTERANLEVDTLTIRIPMRLQRRGGRKLIMTPEGLAAPARKPSRDETLVKALVRAHRWRRRIESGRAKSITDLAEQEDVTDAYVCRLLPLTCLAPDIVEAILDGRQPKGLRLAEVLGNVPLAWDGQRATLGSYTSRSRKCPPSRTSAGSRPGCACFRSARRSWRRRSQGLRGSFEFIGHSQRRGAEGWRGGRLRTFRHLKPAPPAGG